MKKVVVLGAAAFVSVFLYGCSSENKIVAQVGRDKITVDMMAERLKDAPVAYQHYLDTDAGRRQFLDLMVRERVVIESARTAGVTKRKDYVKALADFKQDQSKRLREFEENLLMELYVRDLHEKNIKTSDEDIEKYYQQNLGDFAKPKEVRAQHILLPNREEAEKAFARIRAGEDFGRVAREMSTDPVSAPNGGAIGPFRKGDLIPEFEKAVFPLKIGQTSGIVETPFGFHIIKKTDEKALPSRSMEDAKQEIRRQLEKSRFDAWIEEAKKKYHVNVKYEMLPGIPAVTEPEGEAPAETEENTGTSAETKTDASRQ